MNHRLTRLRLERDGKEIGVMVLDPSARAAGGEAEPRVARDGDGDLDARSAAAALSELRSLDLERHAHEPLLDRIWALRANLTACDAAYLALAEALDATLLTCDARLARAPGARGLAPPRHRRGIVRNADARHER